MGSVVSPYGSLLLWAQSATDRYIVEFHPSDGTGRPSIFTEQCEGLALEWSLKDDKKWNWKMKVKMTIFAKVRVGLNFPKMIIFGFIFGSF